MDEMKQSIDELFTKVSSVLSELKQQKQKPGERGKQLMRISKALKKEDMWTLSQLLNDTRTIRMLERANWGDLIPSVKKYLSVSQAKKRSRFDEIFPELCAQMELPAPRGNSSNGIRFKGILEVKVNFSRNESSIGTYAKTKRVTTVSPERVANEARREYQRLFMRNVEPSAFLEELKDVYLALARTQEEPVPLRGIHEQVWCKRQDRKFFESSDPKNLKPYPLDEFAVDLAQLIESEVHVTSDGLRLRLEMGRDGVPIYDRSGDFNIYKFVRFTQKG